MTSIKVEPPQKTPSKGLPWGFETWEDEYKRTYLKSLADGHTKSQLEDAEKSIIGLKKQLENYENRACKELQLTQETVTQVLEQTQAELLNKNKILEILGTENKAEKERCQLVEYEKQQFSNFAKKEFQRLNSVIKDMETPKTLPIPNIKVEPNDNKMNRIDLEQEMIRLRTQLEAEKERNKNLDKQCDALIQGKADLKKNNIDGLTKIKILEGQNQNLRSDYGKIKNGMLATKVKLDSEIKRCREIDNRYAALADQNIYLQTELETVKNSENKIKSELENCKLMLEKASKERYDQKWVSDGFKEEYEELKSEYDNTLKDRNNLKALNKTLIEDQSSIQKDKDELKRMNADFIKKNNELQEEHSSLKKQLELMEEKCKKFLNTVFRDCIDKLATSFLNINQSVEIIPIVIDCFNHFIEKGEEMNAGWNLLEQWKVENGDPGALCNSNELQDIGSTLEGQPSNSKYQKLDKNSARNTIDGVSNTACIRKAIYAMRNAHGRLYSTATTSQHVKRESSIIESTNNTQSTEPKPEPHYRMDYKTECSNIIKKDLKSEDVKVEINNNFNHDTDDEDDDEWMQDVMGNLNTEGLKQEFKEATIKTEIDKCKLNEADDDVLYDLPDI